MYGMPEGEHGLNPAQGTKFLESIASEKSLCVSEIKDSIRV